MKRLFLIILAFLLTIESVMPVFAVDLSDDINNCFDVNEITASENNDYIDIDGIFYKINNEKAVICGFDADEVKRNIEIPETVQGYEVTEVAEGALKRLGTPETSNSLKPDYYVDSISMPSVKILNSFALSYCGAKNIELPNAEVIGEGAMQCLLRAEEINLPNAVELGENAFYNCICLESISLNNIISIESDAFYLCKMLKKAEIGSSLNSVNGNPFISCISLDDISVSSNNKNFSAKNGILYNKLKTRLISAPAVSGTVLLLDTVNRIEKKAFYLNCNITKVDINNVEKIYSEAFRKCASLLYVNAPKLTYIGKSAFRNTDLSDGFDAPLLSEISSRAFMDSSIQSLDFNKLVNVDYEAFQNTKISSLNLPSIQEIGDGAFSLCTNLTSVTISEDTVSMGINPFYGCSLLTSFKVDSENTKFCAENEILFNKNKTAIIAYPSFSGELIIEDISKKITEIGPGAFYYNDFKNSSLESAELGKVEVIGDYGFGHCSSLTTVSMPNVTEIGEGAFEECFNLTNVSMDNVVTIKDKAFLDSNLQNEIELKHAQYVGDSAFYMGAEGVKSIVLPNVTFVGDNAFSGCLSVTSIELPMLNTINRFSFSACQLLAEIKLSENVNEVREGAFFGCSSLNSIDIHSVDSIETAAFGLCENLKSIDMYHVQQISAEAFSDCKSLTKVQIPFVKCIEENAFENCTMLVSADIFGAEEIKQNAFINCISLSKIDLWNVKQIESNAFFNCKSLSVIDFGNIEKIEDSSFKKCIKLTDVYFYSSCPHFEGIPFENEDFAPVLHFVKGAIGFSTPKLTTSDGTATWNTEEFDPMGDINLDHVTNTGDAVYLLKSCVSILALSERQIMYADVNNDREINTGDVIAILNYCMDISRI